MQTRTVTVCEGELLGPVDWSYDFASHGWDREGCTNPQCVQVGLDTLKQLAAHRGQGTVALYGMRHRVLAYGMYDGWPYWRPIPSVCIAVLCGAEWHCFASICDFQPTTEKAHPDADAEA